jgi:hypothetical protein
MHVKLHRTGFEHAKALIQAGEVESFSSNWNEQKPTHDEVDHYINTHFLKEYGNWFLGRNLDIPDTNKEHYVYPYGDLKEVQRCALVDVIEQAGKRGYKEVVQAAQELLDLVDAQK